MENRGTGIGTSRSEQFSELVRTLTRPVLTIGLAVLWAWQMVHAQSVDPELKTLTIGLATWWFADRAKKEA